MTNIRVDPEFESLIPPMSPEEFEQLVQNIRDAGRIMEAIEVWKGHELVVDGHNRLKAHSLTQAPYEVREVEFESREDVRIYIRRKQLGRRNLTPAVRAEMALGLKEDIAAKAEKAMKSGVGNPSANWREGRPPIPPREKRTDAQLAKMAGVGEGTLRRVETVLKSKDAEVIADMRAGKVSVHAAHQQVTKPRPPVPPRPAKGISGSVAAFNDCKERAVPLDDYAKALDKIRLGMKDLLDHPWAVYLSGATWNSVETWLKDSARTFRDAKPFAPCPRCKDTDPKKDCTVCRGIGWITVVVNRHLAPEDRVKP